MSTMAKNRNGATTRGQTASVTSTGSYVVATGLHGEAKTIIRVPHPHDVLCGRGGGINSHPGNKTFREWVKERKNEYNLASSKVEKARVSKEIVDRIRRLSPPGRFLTRDPESAGVGTAVTGWVEIIDEKAMQKTSQALREGAPKIRADHALETNARSPHRRKDTTTQSAVAAKARTQHSLSPASAAAVSALKRNAEAAKREAEEAERKENQRKRAMPPVPPLMSNANFERAYMRPVKIMRTEKGGRPSDAHARTIDPRMAPTPPPEDTETPPLKPVPPVRLDWPPAASFPMPQAVVNGVSSPSRARKSSPQKSPDGNLIRTNSLALSEIDQDASYLENPFVNPFENEYEDEAPPKKEVVKPARLSRTLTTGSSSSHGDLGGIGALMNDNPKSEVRGIKTGYSRRSSRSLSSSSDLSDLLDVSYRPSDYYTDFDEGMKAVFDAAHPGLTSPWTGDVIPTHLYPFQGIKKTGRLRTSSNLASTGSFSSLNNNLWDSRQ